MKVGVLGGGLSGLVAAGHSRHDCQVLEADSVVGGHCRSLMEDGFTFDLGGPHILFSKDKETLSYMISLLGENAGQMRRNNQIYYEGRTVKYPFENGLYDLDPQDRFECLYYYLMNDYPEPRNFKEWVYFTFGKGIAEKYMIPYNEKIWNVPAGEMTFDWVEGRVPRPPVEDVIKSAVGVETEGYTHQLYFTYPKSGGIESLIKGFAAKCSDVVTGFPVTKVWREGDDWCVSSHNGGEVRRYDRIVSTIPLEDMIAALPDVPAEITTAVGALRYNSLTVVMLGAKSDDPPPYTALYVPSKDYPFHRLSFPLNFTSAGAPPGHMAVAAEITTNPGDGFHDLDDAAVTEQVITGIADMGFIDPDAIVFRRVYRTKHAYVVRSFGYEENLSRALDYIESLGIISLGRNAEFEYINMDEAVRRGLAVARRLDEESH